MYACLCASWVGPPRRIVLLLELLQDQRLVDSPVHIEQLVRVVFRVIGLFCKAIDRATAAAAAATTAAAEVAVGAAAAAVAAPAAAAEAATAAAAAAAAAAPRQATNSSSMSRRSRTGLHDLPRRASQVSAAAAQSPHRTTRHSAHAPSSPRTTRTGSAVVMPADTLARLRSGVAAVNMSLWMGCVRMHVVRRRHNRLTRHA